MHTRVTHLHANECVYQHFLNLIHTNKVFTLLGVKWKYEHCIQEMHSEEDKIIKEN